MLARSQGSEKLPKKGMIGYVGISVVRPSVSAKCHLLKLGWEKEALSFLITFQRTGFWSLKKTLLSCRRHIYISERERIYNFKFSKQMLWKRKSGAYG